MPRKESLKRVISMLVVPVAKYIITLGIVGLLCCLCLFLPGALNSLFDFFAYFLSSYNTFESRLSINSTSLALLPPESLVQSNSPSMNIFYGKSTSSQTFNPWWLEPEENDIFPLMTIESYINQTLFEIKSHAEKLIHDARLAHFTMYSSHQKSLVTQISHFRAKFSNLNKLVKPSPDQGRETREPKLRKKEKTTLTSSSLKKLEKREAIKLEKPSLGYFPCKSLSQNDFANWTVRRFKEKESPVVIQGESQLELNIAQDKGNILWTGVAIYGGWELQGEAKSEILKKKGLVQLANPSPVISIDLTIMDIRGRELFSKKVEIEAWQIHQRNIFPVYFDRPVLARSGESYFIRRKGETDYSGFCGNGLKGGNFRLGGNFGVEIKDVSDDPGCEWPEVYFKLDRKGMN